VCPFCSTVRALVVGATLVACHGGASSSGDEPVSPVDAAVDASVRKQAAVYGGPPPRPAVSAPVAIDAGPPLDVDGGVLAPHAASQAKAQAQYKRCFNQGLKTDPHMEGKLVVSVQVGADGKSLSATITNNTGLSSDVAACVAAAAGALEFSPPAGGGATVDMPVELKSE
jgi:hypothetical protein